MSNRTLALIVMLIVAQACSVSWTQLPVPSTPSAAFSESDLRAGIAEVDITPPTDLGMFGHGPESRVSVGTQLRLRCQAFVIVGAAPSTTTHGEAVALVPCDLSSPSLLLQREIARRVAEQHVPLGAERILLMATHTHMAPAHYFGVGNYTGPFSSRLTGFDQHVLDFLSTRIAGAIVAAYQQRVKAQLGWSQGPITTRLTRNRNPLAFLRNHDVPAWLRARIAEDAKHPEEGAVDPTLSVLRIERYDAASQAYVPYGGFAAFAMHPTALPNTTDMYSGDVFGYATRYVEQSLRGTEDADSAHAPAFVLGIANGIEGDVMPARNSAGQREARRLGHGLAQEILTRFALATTLDSHAMVHVAYRELGLPNAETSCGRPLCPLPALGSGSGGGASDHPTLLRAFPQITPGATAIDASGCHGPKLPLLLPSGSTVAGRDFPKMAPMSLVQIGTHVIATMPAEVTTVTGVRIREAIATELGLPQQGDNVGRSVVVVGLTNEYLQYVATDDEYELQLYEGASTLYGPRSAAFLQDHAVCLAHWLSTHDDSQCRLGQRSNVNDVGVFEYVKQTDSARMHEASAGPIGKLAQLSAPITEELTHDGQLEASLWFAGPNNQLVQTRADLWVEVRHGDANGAVLATDEGTSVSLRYEAGQKGAPWQASFVPELQDLPGLCGAKLVFVLGSRGVTQSSIPFELDCSRARALTLGWP